MYSRTWTKFDTWFGCLPPHPKYPCLFLSLFLFLLSAWFYSIYKRTHAAGGHTATSYHKTSSQPIQPTAYTHTPTYCPPPVTVSLLSGPRRRAVYPLEGRMLWGFRLHLIHMHTSQHIWNYPQMIGDNREEKRELVRCLHWRHELYSLRTECSIFFGPWAEEAEPLFALFGNLFGCSAAEICFCFCFNFYKISFTNYDVSWCLICCIIKSINTTVIQKKKNCRCSST